MARASCRFQQKLKERKKARLVFPGENVSRIFSHASRNVDRKRKKDREKEKETFSTIYFLQLQISLGFLSFEKRS